jgi:hypothetical protein
MISWKSPVFDTIENVGNAPQNFPPRILSLCFFLFKFARYSYDCSLGFFFQYEKYLLTFCFGIFSLFWEVLPPTLFYLLYLSEFLPFPDLVYLWGQDVCRPEFILQVS